jgi:transposase-like protein
MPRTHQPYAPEYRRRIIELARVGRSVNELAREFEPTAETIRRRPAPRNCMIRPRMRFRSTKSNE